MSAYPPPPPIYDRKLADQQRRWMKQQANLQRQLIRQQMRANRRRSVVGPLVLLGLGIVFLEAQTGKLSWAQAVVWYGHWWPVVLIAAGLVLMAEWAIDLRPQPDGTVRHARVLGGGVVLLLILLAVAGAGAHSAERAGMVWHDGWFSKAIPSFDMALGDRHDADDTVSSTIVNGGSLLIRNPHGDVTVTGSSNDGQVHVSVHKQAFAHNDDAANDKERRLQPTFREDGGNLVLDVASVDGGQADLTVEVPRTTALTVRADHGAIDVQEIHAAVSLSANSGEVSLSGIDGPVSAHINNEGSSFSAHSVTGSVGLDGRAGDINLSDITGAVTLQGDFFGTTHMERVNGGVLFKTSRTQFEAQRIDGEFEVALDSDLEASQVLGPIRLTTRDRAVSLDRVLGSVQVTNRNGSVTVTNAAPLADIDINNSKGSVDVGVPPNAGFRLDAETRDGDIENDFGLKAMQSEHSNVLTATVGAGGPMVKLHTTDGDVTVRKATVTMIPMKPPVAPRISVAPAPAGGPKAPRAPKAPMPPTAPSAARAEPSN